MKEFILEENDKVKGQFHWRALTVLEQGSANEIVLDGKKYLNFSSNDYLGYSRHPQVVRAAVQAAEKYGAGSRSSRLVSGTLDLHKELEESLAKFKGSESALIFPTGFMANLGVLSALLGPGDAVIMDRLNHASLIDAAKLSRSRLFVYDHCSVESLEKILHRTRSYKKRLVVTDSLFSMDGDFAPLPQIVELCKMSNVWLMMDDAHATGIFGEDGIGMAEYFNLLGKIEIVIGTLSKTLGSQGGFVCGPIDLIHFMINKARPFIYTTALSPPSCAAALKAISLIGSEPHKRKYLKTISKKFIRELKENFHSHSKLLERTESQIVPFWAGPSGSALSISRKLADSGIFVPAIRPPTVPKGQSRLRFSLTSEHREEDIRKLVETLELIVKEKPELTSEGLR